MSTALERKWYAAVASIGECMLCGSCEQLEISHSNMLRGLSRKSAPQFTARLCHNCHSEIDAGHELDRDKRRALHCLAVMKTHDALIRAGKLVLKDGN